MLSRTLVIGVLLTAARGWSQPAPEFDASIPDASVGAGGAEQSQEADEGRTNGLCSQSRDCERGFACNNGRCTWVGYRVATPTGGCGALGAAPLIFALGLYWSWRRRGP